MLPTFKTFPSLVDDFLGRDFLANWNSQTGITVPSVNISETKDNFQIEVAAPGLEKSDFKIDLHNNILIISSEKESNEEKEGEKMLRREFSYSSFKRSFTLPNSVNTESISATHKDGILCITVPKREEAKVKPVRQIAID